MYDIPAPGRKLIKRIALHNILNTCGTTSGDLRDYGEVFGYLDIRHEDWLDDPDNRYDPDQIKEIIVRVYSEFISCVLYDDGTSRVWKHSTEQEMLDAFEVRRRQYEEWRSGDVF